MKVSSNTEIEVQVTPSPFPKGEGAGGWGFREHGNSVKSPTLTTNPICPISPIRPIGPIHQEPPVSPKNQNPQSKIQKPLTPSEIPSHLELRTSHSPLPQQPTTNNQPASRLLTLYGEYLMPRLKRVRPRGYERPGERRTDHRFQAWLRVVTEPRYAEFEPDVKRFYTGEGVRTRAVTEFEAILTISLVLTPFKRTELADSEPTQLKGALIPASAAAIFAGVAVKTIHRWIEKGLKHQKKGAYYWISVQDLERFYESKQTNRKRGTRPPLPLATKE